MRKLYNDDTGFIVSAELVLVLTIGVLSMVVGLASLRDSLTSEFCDLSSAFGALDQSYFYRTVGKPSAGTKGFHAQVFGAGYQDTTDDCDCIPTTFIAITGKPDASGGTANEGNGGI